MRRNTDSPLVVRNPSKTGGRAGNARGLRSATALATGLLAVALATPAFAQTGGAGGAGTYGSGGAGGAAGTTGGDATCTPPFNEPGCQNTGGAAGIAGGGNGADGATAAGAPGGGGGGGGNGTVNFSPPPSNPIIGGNGGNGGDAQSGISSNGGGGGGAGGDGFVAFNGSINNTFLNLFGGNGGNGGAGAVGADNSVGNGGAGGDGGNAFRSPGNFLLILGTGVTAIGGNGGLGGLGSAGGIDGAVGRGGAGIFSTGDLLLRIDGTVSGGLSGDGLTRANSLTLTGSYTELQLFSNAVLVGDIEVTGVLEFLQSSDFDVTNIIYGPGSVTKTGTATLILSGDNSYEGGTNVVAGTLGLGTDTAAGTGRIALADTTTLLNAACGCGLTVANNIEIALGGAATFDSNGGDVLLSGGISGGDLTFADSSGFSIGLVTLTGANEYGATNITGGAVQIGDGGTTGTLGLGNVTMAVNTGLGFFRSDDITVGNAISGDGILAQLGSGILTLTGINTYTGGTLILDGLINFASGDNLGTGNIILVDGGLQWATGNTFDISGRLDPIFVSGTFDTNGNDVTFLTGLSGGDVIKTGEGTLTFAADNFYGGSTTILGGTLRVGDGVTTGTLGGGDVNVYGGTLVFDRVDDVTYANDLNMYGTLVQAGAGQVTLQGSNFVQGGIRLDAGILNLESAVYYDEGSLLTFNGGSFRQATDQLWDGFLALRWNATNSSTLSAADGVTLTIYSSLSIENGVNGNPTLTFGTASNRGTIILNSAADFTGDGTGSLVIGGGTLTTQFGNDVLNVLASGVGTVQINPAGTLDLSDAADFTAEQAIRNLIGQGGLVLGGVTNILQGDFSGIISGAGSLVMLGEGTLRLAGFNTYSGSTSVLAGTLEFSGGALFGTSLIEVGNGATIRTLTNNLLGGFFVFPRLSVLDGGGTIDTGAFSLDVLGSVDFGALLTKTGSGVLTLIDFQNNSTGAGGIDVLGGTLALTRDGAAGTGIIRLADGTTLANAACFCGLTLANNIEVAANGLATIDAQQRATTLNGILSGGNISFISNTGQSSEGGSAIFTLNGANTYGATSIGPNVQLVLRDGTLGSGDTQLAAALVGPGQTPGTLVFGNTADYSYGGAITGAGAVRVQTVNASTVITLTGSNTTANPFTGTVQVNNGQLNLNGTLGDLTGLSASMVVNGGTVGGSGSFYGNVTVGNGALAVGNSPGTLNIAGNLTLGAGTILNYEFGQPGVVGNNVNDFVTVGGNLTLDGTLNVINFGPSYGPGYYALFRYGGTLTNNTLNIGSIDGGLATSLLFNINGQVNLLLGPQVVQYWDGVDTTGVSVGSGALNGNGGAGTWSASNTNWTGATGFGVNDQWRSTVGVFAGLAGGTVTVEGTQAFQELRFQTSNYLLRPFDANARLNTTGGFSVIDVNAGLTADIGVIIQGGAGLTKTGSGTLLLSAVNTYSGATSVAAGTLRLGIDNAISSQSDLDVSAGATFDLAGFSTQAGSLAGAGAVTLNAGTLNVGYSNNSTTFGGTVTGDGVFTKQGSGTLTLTGGINLTLTSGINTFIQINAGTLDIAATGSATADLLQNFATITNGGTLTAGQAFQNFGTFTNSTTGTVTGTSQNFGTFDNQGVMGSLQSLGGTATNSGTINGNVQSFTGFTSTGIINGSLSNFSTALIQNQVNGEVGNFQTGATITLTGTTTGITRYQGVNGATLDLAGFNTTVGGLSGAGDILLGGATLTFGDATFHDFSGVISGNGALIKVGLGTQVLSGANTYVGPTNVNAGTLQLGGNFALPSLTALTVAAGATFDLSSFITQIATLSGGGTVQGSGGLDIGGTNGNSIFTGAFAGSLSVSKSGTGSLTLTGNSTLANLSLYDGTTTLGAAGILNGGVTIYGFAGTPTFVNDGTINGLVTAYGGNTDNNGTINGVVENRTTTFVNDGTIRGTGFYTLFNIFGGVFTNNGLIDGRVQNAEFGGGGTLINTGTITGFLENVAGGVVNSTGTINGTLNNYGTATLAGQLNGSIVNQNGGSVTLTGTTTGITSYNGQPGALFLDLANFNTAIDSISGTGEIRLGSAFLTIGANDAFSAFSGVISGSGGLNKVGADVAFLSGANTYSGLTTVSDGALEIQAGGSLAGDVLNNATFRNYGTVGGTLDNDGTAENGGTISQFVNNSGTFTTTGIVNPLVSGLALTNNAGGTVNAQGQINGLVQNSGTFNVTGSLGGITRFNQFGAAVLNLQGNDLALGGLGGSGSVNLGGATLTVGVGNLNSTFGGVISGSGGLTKVGSDLFTLGGVNSYTGTTLVSAGTLRVAGSGVIAGPVVNNATLENFAAINGQVTNNGTYTQVGNLNANLINTGTAAIRGQLNGNVDNQSGTILLTGTTTGIGRFNQASGALFDLANFNTAIGSLSGNGEVRLGTATLTLGGDNSNSSFAGSINGTGGVAKVGTGTFTLTGSNSFSGPASVQGGTLALGVNNALTGPTLISVDAGATLALGDTFQVLGALAGAGNIQLGSNGGMLVGNGDLSATFSGTIGSGVVMRKIGTGTQTFSGNTTFTIIYVDDGELRIGAGGVLTSAFGNNSVLTNLGTINGFGSNNNATALFTNSGTINGSILNDGILINSGAIGRVDNNLTFSSTGSVTNGLGNRGDAQIRGQLAGGVDNLGTITLTGATTGIGVVNQAAGALFNLNGVSTAFGGLRGTGEVRLGSALLTVGSSNGDDSFAGIITGSGAGNGVTKVGTGTLTLSGVNTYTGLTTVSAGTLTLSSTGRLTGNVLNNATFNNDGRVDLIVENRGTGSNAGQIVSGLINSGSFTSTGIIGVGLNNNLGGIFNGRGQLNGFVTNSGTFNVTGTLTGITAFSQTATGRLNLGGRDLALGSLDGLGVINLDDALLTVGGSNVDTIFGGVIAGSGALAKVGTGTLSLGGVNTFTGSTTVAGRLNILAGGALAGSLTNNGLVENRGAIGGLVTNNGIMFSYGTIGGGLTNNAAGQFNNDTLAVITGAVRNDGRLDNFGTINGIVTNTGNLLSARAINGGLVNSGTALLGGTLSGPLTNNGGTVTLGGTTTGITAFTQLAGATFNLAGFNTAIGSLAGAGSVQLGGAILTVGDNNSTTFAGIISGTGASGVTKVGTGTLTLSGVNTYAGLTTVNAGTLSVASTGSIGLGLNFATLLNAGAIGTVDNRAGGTFTNSGTVTNGVINAGAMTSTGIINTGFENSGTAQLRGQLNGFVNANGGTITLTGTLTGITTFTQAGGATLNLNGFSLSIGTLSGAGSITFGSIAGTGSLEPATAPSIDLATVAAAVTRAGLTPADNSGGNGATQSMIGSAEVATAAAAAATPTWLVADIAAPDASGSLNASNGRAAGFGLTATESAQAAPGAGLVAIESPMVRAGSTAFGDNGGTASITDGSAPAVADANGAQVVTLTGGGDLVQIADVAPPAAPVILTAGGSTLTPQALPAATGPVLTVGSGNVDSLFSGVISGNGRLAKVGTGTLILTGNNTYTDGTLISGGVLQLGNGGTSGSIVGRIENNAILVVNRSDALTLSGIIDGTGLFVQAGTGTTTLTGANAYTGGTLITAGRLRGDSVSLQGQFQINAGTLEFNQAAAGTFAGQLFGAGALEKTGAGLLTFTGDNSNLTGGTTVSGGELRVNSLLSRSRVTVGNGGTLSGTSIVGGLTAQSGGTVAPGAGGFGTLGVNGTIQFLAGSTFAAQVQPSGSDLLLGNNTAQLAGTIAVAGAAGVYRFNSVYVLLQADGGRTGTFATETGLNSFGQAYAPRIVYTPTQVQLLLAPNQLLNIAGTAGTPNQRSTLTRIDAAVAAGYDPQPLFALYSLTPQAAFLGGADQLSGEIYATSVRVALDDERLVREATLGRLRLTQDMGFSSGFGAWGHAVGAWGSGDTDGNAARYRRDQQGFVVGIDGGGSFAGGGWRVGLLGHHISTDVRVDARGSNADIGRSGGGIYAGLDFGGLRIRAGGTYSSLNLEGRRSAAFTGFAESLAGQTDGTALQGFAEISYRLQVGASTHVEPYVQAALARVEFDAFSETGGTSRLRVAAEEDDLTTLAFGMRAGTVMPIGANTNLRLDGAVGGRFLSGDRMIFSLISLDVSPNQAFDIRSAAADRFAVTGNADATFEFGRSVSLSVGYSGVISGNARDHAGRATLGIRF